MIRIPFHKGYRLFSPFVYVVFCIIEGPETVQYFAKMESQEIDSRLLLQSRAEHDLLSTRSRSMEPRFMRKLGDPKKHLTLGHLLDKPCFLGLLAVKAGTLYGFHANTHTPVVVGSQMQYEITGDPVYKLLHIWLLILSETYSASTSSNKDVYSLIRKYLSLGFCHHFWS